MKRDCLHLSKTSGFTLMEILVATGVSILIVGLLFTLLNTSIRLWQENERRIDAFREARAALHFMSREIRSATVIDESVADSFLYFPEAENNTNRSVAMPDNLAGDSLLFLSTQPLHMQPSGNKSDICAIGYFLVKQGKVGTLYRYFRGSDSTFSLLLGEAPRNLFQGIKAEQTTVDGSPAYFNEILAHNVINFKIRFYGQNTSGHLEELDAKPYNKIPSLIEIELTTIDSKTARRINETADSVIGDRLRQQAAQNFTTRIKPSGNP